MFRVRNAFTAHNKTALTANEKEVQGELALLKGKTALTANEKEVQGELALLKGQKSYYVLGKGVVEHVFRITNNPDFFSGLPMQTAQHVIRQVCTEMVLQIF
ncbi:hypothetical protein CGK76_10830 [Erysipelotrichaceae bacterium 7770_A6]|nr:hypothetical protein [Erysipelotrichaceae bacterium 7770_A6]